MRAEDDLLAVRCQLGEPAAFDDLVRRWHGPLWSYVRRVTGDDDAAAAVVLDAWVRIVRGITNLREPERLRAWLFGVARRAVMDRLRERYRTPPRLEVDATVIDTMTDTRELEEELALLETGLQTLPAVEREVLVLFYLRELSLNEIADVLAIPTGTIKSRLFRARNLLRARLETKGVQR